MLSFPFAPPVQLLLESPYEISVLWVPGFLLRLTCGEKTLGAAVLTLEDIRHRIGNKVADKPWCSTSPKHYTYGRADVTVRSLTSATSPSRRWDRGASWWHDIPRGVCVWLYLHHESWSILDYSWTSDPPGEPCFL